MRRKQPLFRKVNTRTRGVHHGGRKDYRFERNTKQEKHSETNRGSMHPGQRHGLDYTPLFKFLLSKVGEDWASVHSEAVSRLDREEPIYWMVARSEMDRLPYFRTGNAYFSGLFVDENSRLALVDPSIKNEDFTPGCPCCTHTFNGVPFTRRYGQGES